MIFWLRRSAHSFLVSLLRPSASSSERRSFATSCTRSLPLCSTLTHWLNPFVAKSPRNSVVPGSFWNALCSEVPLQSCSSSLAPLTGSPVCTKRKTTTKKKELVMNCFEENKKKSNFTLDEWCAVLPAVPDAGLQKLPEPPSNRRFHSATRSSKENITKSNDWPDAPGRNPSGRLSPRAPS